MQTSSTALLSVPADVARRYPMCIHCMYSFRAYAYNKSFRERGDGSSGLDFASCIAFEFSRSACSFVE